jgi:hypothetical protein
MSIEVNKTDRIVNVTVIKKFGKDGAPFTYDMFTQEQLDGLKGEPGVPGSDANVTEANITTALGINPKNDVISFAISDTSSDLTAGDTDSFIAPYNFTLTGYFISVGEAPTGSNLVVDLKKNGVSVTSTNASIESGETSSITGIAPVIATSTFSKGDLITPNINQVGALTTGKSLKIYLEITKQ